MLAGFRRRVHRPPMASMPMASSVGSADRGAKSGVALRWDGQEGRRIAVARWAVQRAIGINADGVIVGYSSQDDAGELVRAVRWVDGEIEEIGTLGGEISQATAINRHGEIVGIVDRRGGLQRGRSRLPFSRRRDDHAGAAWQDQDPAAGPAPSSWIVRSRSASTTTATFAASRCSASENDPISVATLWLGDEVLDLNAPIGKSQSRRSS